MERNEVRGNFRYDWCIDMFPLIQIQKMFPADLRFLVNKHIPGSKITYIAKLLPKAT